MPFPSLPSPPLPAIALTLDQLKHHAGILALRESGWKLTGLVRSLDTTLASLTAPGQDALPSTPATATSTLALTKSFHFQKRGYPAAIAFLTQLALRAEAWQHHPHVWQVYDRVTIQWSTHDCQNVSERDVVMAEYCDELYQGLL